MELDYDLESRERLINNNSRAHYKNAPIWQTSFSSIQNLFRHIHRYFFSTDAQKTEDTVTNNDTSLLWANGLNYNVIFYQGMMLSQQQIVQYIGENAIELTTGESIRPNQKRIYLFQPQHIWLYPEIPEIDRNIGVGWYSHQHIMHWAFGLRIAQLTDKPEYGQTHPHQEDGCVVNYFGVRASRSSLGQTSDKEAHKAKHDALMKIRPENTVLFGVSRGGATTFAALAEYRYENIKLCLLEGAPGSISSLFKVYFKYIPYLGKLLYNPYTAYLFLGHLHKTEKNIKQ